MNPSTIQVASLRQTVAAGAYEVDAQRVAGAIVRKIVEVDRLRRSLATDGSSVYRSRR